MVGCRFLFMIAASWMHMLKTLSRAVSTGVVSKTMVCFHFSTIAACDLTEMSMNAPFLFMFNMKERTPIQKVVTILKRNVTYFT